VGATVGALLTGVFATTAVNAAGADASLLLFGKQALGVAVAMAFSGALTFGLLRIVGLVTPLRSDEQDEWTGLDHAEAGERGYVNGDMDSAHVSPPSPAHDEAAAPALSAKAV
jgi:Amt family ammonium transporter